MNDEMSRYKMPREVAEAIRTATRAGFIDALDGYAMGANHGDDWRALLDELVQVAWTHWHAPDARKACGAVAAQRDAYVARR